MLQLIHFFQLEGSFRFQGGNQIKTCRSLTSALGSIPDSG